MQVRKMNYWDRQKSFWKTPAGIVIWFALLVAILGGGLLALNIFVSPYPVIESFDANPPVIQAGEATNLSWSVVGASHVFIDHGIGQVDLKGFEKATPSETTTYELTAVNGSRNGSMEVLVMVSPQHKT
jgi:hypothetical protein